MATLAELTAANAKKLSDQKWTDYASSTQDRYRSNLSTSPLALNVAGLEKPFVQTLQSTLETPGLKPAAIERRIAGEMDRFGEAERDAGLNLKTAAAAMGFGRSGSLAGGMQRMQSDFAGQRGKARQGILNDADLLASQEKMGALNIASRPVLQERAFAQEQALKNATGGQDRFAGLPGMPSSSGQGLGILSQGSPDPGRGGRGNSLGGGPRIIGGGTGITSSDKKGPGITHYTGSTPYGEGTFKNGVPYTPYSKATGQGGALPFGGMSPNPANYNKKKPFAVPSAGNAWGMMDF